jgi:hypothetical protein
MLRPSSSSSAEVMGNRILGTSSVGGPKKFATPMELERYTMWRVRLVPHA